MKRQQHFAIQKTISDAHLNAQINQFKSTFFDEEDARNDMLARQNLSDFAYKRLWLATVIRQTSHLMIEFNHPFRSLLHASVQPYIQPSIQLSI